MKKRFLLSALVLALFALCFMGCSTDSNDDDPDPYTVLIFTGVSAEANIIGGSVVDFEKEEPVASGMFMNSRVNLFEPDANFMPSDKPWKGKGDYMVALAGSTKNLTDPTFDPMTDTVQYIYVGFDVSAIMAIDFSNPMAAMGEIMALFATNPELMGQLMTVETSMMVSFDNTVSKSFAWKEFMNREVLEVLQGYLSQMM
jgi:hypothetical protein